MQRRQFIAGTTATVLSFAAPTYAQTDVRASVIKRIAMFHSSEPPEGLSINGRRGYKAFFGELNKLGYNEGQNLIVERYSALGKLDRYGDIARAIVASHPDLIISLSGAFTRILKTLPATIPVLALTADPVAGGIVTNLAKPERNITGVSTDVGLEVFGKRLQLLREMVVLTNVRLLIAPSSVAFWEMAGGQPTLEAARRAGIPLTAALVPEPLDRQAFQRVFDAMAVERVDGLMVGDAAEFLTNRQLIVDLTANHRLPTIYYFRDFVEVGGLLSYGVDLADAYRRMANMANELLRGAKPGDIPYYRLNKFELVLNRTTARSLGLEFPASLLAVADEVIE